MTDRWQEPAETLRKPKTLVVNLYGGPGVGKSTTAAMTFALLKEAGVTAELVTEVAKDFVWEERTKSLGNQVYIFGKQYHRLWRLLGEVDVIVTDGPLLLSLYYAAKLPGGDEIASLAETLHGSMRNLDVLITRNNAEHPYNPRGRYQDLQGAEKVDRELSKALSKVIRPVVVETGKNAAGFIVDMIGRELAQA